MTIEMLYLTTQFQQWLNFQVARHLQAQAAKLRPASPEGIGMSGCNGPGAGYSYEGSPTPRSDKQTVHA